MSEYQDVADFVDENVNDADYTDVEGEVNPKMNGRADPQPQEEVYYKFSYSRQSIKDAGKKAVQAGTTALQTGLAVDDLMERRRQARRQVRRQNMSDGLRLLGFVADVFL